MEEIKFKVWDKIKKEWVGLRGFGINNQIGVISCEFLISNLGNDRKLEEFVFCQFIGLRDKKGREIYRKDIVKFMDRRPVFGHPEMVVEGEATVVEFINGEFCCDIKNKEWWKYVEVIGNACEN